SDLVNGKAVRVEDVAERKWRIVSAGPVRVIVELTYKGWKIAGHEVNLTSRMTQWAGERGFEHRVTADGAEGVTLVTGIGRQPDLLGNVLPSASSEPMVPSSPPLSFTRLWWGHQVVEEGPSATATHM